MMALLKKSAPVASEPYRVPSLSEADGGYAALQVRRGELQDKQRELSTEQRALQKAIASDTSHEVRPSIAELLGDEPGTKAFNRKRLAKVNTDISDLDQALRVIDQRIRDARGAASRVVCASARPEYARRVRAMVAAMRTLDEAHKAYDELRWQLEAEDIAWTSLVPMSPVWLGSSNEADRRITRFIRDAEAAGYGD
ncbi:hypothetical protein ASD64_14665 [Mesorhizobium sp. Root157]|uniref:hypothetical protein n=1 Tax=Mesorhizobium sp. Root157 TaxID=1736477 RepID=UPI0006F75E46|nr:hypothetical protein [Mesorhizobium sp. Root157]KQZ99571.1 hypothetical protein ASD64_14665 [Mesorhizobium sp. Root157]